MFCKMEVEVKCIKSLEDFDLKLGTVYLCDLLLDLNGATTFVIHQEDGSEIKCVQEWFGEFFELFTIDSIC